MSYETKKSTRNNRLMRSIMRKRNNRMYQLDQIMLKKKKKKKRERREPRPLDVGMLWPVKVRWEEAKVIKMICGKKSSGGVGERVIRSWMRVDGRGYLRKSAFIAFFSPDFPLDLGDQQSGPGRENFLPSFLSFPFSFSTKK